MIFKLNHGSRDFENIEKILNSILNNKSKHSGYF